MSVHFSYKPLWKIHTGQDGAIYDDLLFRFNSRGDCKVYSLTEQTYVSAFTLDQVETIRPHSNAVCFGKAFFQEGDRFPLLYTNIYNNYSGQEARMEGVCCVYRITQEGDQFSSRLVQIIRIGFVENLDLWKSLENNGDVRPYGNFVVDADHDRLLAFTMRDKDLTTRYFSFDLPAVSEGVFDETYHANVVTLETEDIKEMFDCGYSHFLQGACYHDNKIFSVEGFNVADPANIKNPPRLQIIDLGTRTVCADIDLYGHGLAYEPEFIEIYQGCVYYGDSTDTLYRLSFE